MSNPFTRFTDLDVDAPEKVAKRLRDAAEQYRESASELASAWHDKNAGKVWDRIATQLERAAQRIEEIVANG